MTDNNGTGQMPPDNLILEKARQGDQQATTALVMKYQHLVRNYLYSLTPDPSLADDLAQEVFVKFFGSLERIKSEKSIKPYLMRMTRNMAIDHWRKLSCRKNKYHEVFFDDLERLYGQQTMEVEDNAFSQRLEALGRCLKTLSDRIYRVIMGFYYENQSCRELSKCLEIKEGNVRTLLYRGRKALLTCIVKQTKKIASIK